MTACRPSRRDLVGSWIAWLFSLACAVAFADPMPPESSLPGSRRAATSPTPMALAGTAPPPAPPPAVAPFVPSDPSAPGFVLRAVQFTGDDTLPRDGLAEIYAPFINQWVTLADLEELRYRLTQHYVAQGYLNSGLVIEPEQIIRDGVVRMRIVVGRLGEIRVAGQGRLRPSYLIQRVRLPADAPLNRDALQERFQLLLENPLIEWLDGTLLPSAEPGIALLDLQVERARPWELFLRVNNFRTPNSGAERYYLGGALHNPAGFGDRLELLLGRAFEGSGKEAVFHYSIPLTAAETRLFAHYEYNDAPLLERQLADLDIASATHRAELGVEHAIWHSLARQLRLGLSLQHARNRTTLLGRSFSFDRSSVDGKTRSTALRLTQEYAGRGAGRAYALRSVFSFGIDALDATVHRDRPDSRFLVWLGQWQYVQRLTDDDLQMNLRGGVQLASESLLALDRFSLGGVNSVRGYRENTAVADNAYAITLEFRYPVWSGIGFADTAQTLHLAAFADAGGAWNHRRADGGRQDLFSLGVGAIWALDNRLRAELHLARPLRDAPKYADANWQDDGIHFQVQADF